MIKKYCALVLAMAMAVCAFASGCGDKDDEKDSAAASANDTSAVGSNSQAGSYTMEELGLGADFYDDKEHEAGYQLESPDQGEEVAVMHTSMGDITMRFFPEAAPKAVESFITHAKDGYYNGITFHRVINNFMIQGGDPTGTGSGGESAFDGGKDFEDEFSNKLFNLRGSVAMANSGADTNGSQFFINQSKTGDFSSSEANWEQVYSMICQMKDAGSWEDNKEGFSNYMSYINFLNTDIVPDDVKALYKKVGGNPSLDGAFNAIDRGHTVFAQVIDGMDVVDAIAAVKTDDNNKPVEDVVIEGIDIVKYGE